MQITVNIPDDFAVQVVAVGLTPEAYVEQLIAGRAGPATHVATDTSSTLGDLEVFFAEMGAYSDKISFCPTKSLPGESFYQTFRRCEML